MIGSTIVYPIMLRRTPLKPSRLPIGARSKGRDPKRYADSALKRKVLARDLWLCHWCGRPVTMETGVADHVLPWKLGGPTTLGNLVAACARCNKLHSNTRDWKLPEAHDSL